MPEGFEEYDWKNGWPLINSRQVVLFGRGVEKKKKFSFLSSRFGI